MRIRALVAAVVLTAALTIPANAFAYLTWFEFTRQSNSASVNTKSSNPVGENRSSIACAKRVAYKS